MSRKPIDGHGSLRNFAVAIRQYVSAWPVLIACLIGPVTKYLRLVPIYKDHENILAGITSLYGFLLAAALFYYRPLALHRARTRSGRGISAIFLRLLPGVLIVLSIASFFYYLRLVQSSILEQRNNIRELVETTQLETAEILARTDYTNIPNGTELLTVYVVTFLAAESSLVMMALVEYVESSTRSAKRKA